MRVNERERERDLWHLPYPFSPQDLLMIVYLSNLTRAQLAVAERVQASLPL